MAKRLIFRLYRYYTRLFAMRATTGQRCLAIHLHCATHRSALR